MLPSIQLGKYFGIRLYIHWSWFLLPIIGVFSIGDEINPYFWLCLIVGAFTCVVMHEYGHALMAKYFGIGTRDITLYPIGGVARLDHFTEKPIEEFWIAVAGPAVNVAIVIILAICGFSAVMLAGFNTVVESLIGQYLFYLGVANIFLVVFNMLPVFPMDGGRVLRALLAMWLGQLQATRIAANVGMVFAIMLGMFGLLSGQIILALVSLFVIVVGQLELRAVEMKHRPKQAMPFPFFSNRGFAQDDAEEGVINLERTGPNSYGQTKEESDEPYFQPKVSVYVWDNESGIWVKSPGPGFTGK